MNNATLKGFYRDEKGKAVKKIREKGFIPGIVYGHNKETLGVKIEKSEFERFFYNSRKGSSLDLVIDGATRSVILKEVQKDVIKNKFLHVDFQELTAGEKVRVPIQIKVLNRDKIENSNSTVQEMFHEIEVSVLPKDLTDSFSIDVSEMKLGDVIRLRDMDFFEDSRYSFHNGGEDILIAFTEAKKATESEEETTAGSEDNISVL